MGSVAGGRERYIPPHELNLLSDGEGGVFISRDIQISTVGEWDGEGEGALYTCS